MVKINLGCGNDYREGWVNVDFNKEVKADIYADFTKKLPFKKDYADLIYMDNVLEHLPRDKLMFFLEELHRITKPDGVIHIYVPHYTSMYAFKHLTHYNYFGIGSFSIMQPKQSFSGERYNKARFVVTKERLLFFHHNLVNFPLLSKLPINWLFNFGDVWRQLMERFQFLGFDEIYYELKPYKPEQAPM